MAVLTVFVRLSLWSVAAGTAAWAFSRDTGILIPGLASLFAGVVIAGIILDRSTAAPRPEIDLAPEEQERPRAGRRALIVGSGALGRSLAEHLERDAGYRVVGFVDDRTDLADGGEWDVLGGRETTAQMVRQHGVDEVFVAYAPTWQQRLAEELAAREPGVRVWVVPTPFEAALQLGSVENAGDIALVQLLGESRRGQEMLKRVFDVTASLLGLVVLAPLCALVALLIRLTSPGPAIFAQERTGRYGQTFVLFKFRTMVQDAEARTGPVLAAGEQDARLTWLGRWLRKFRIDEVPQLWNVVRGEMSLVGPRPERPHFVRQFERLTPSYARRHHVRPGITGLAQVCAGYHTDARDKLRFDLIYASHQSVWLDLQILARTVMVVLRPSGK